VLSPATKYALFLVVAGLMVGGGASRGMAEPQSFEAAAHHWSFQPIRRPPVPSLRGNSRITSPVDALLLAKLAQKGLGFSPPAEPRILLRRAYYDLIGLPPTIEAIRAFEKNHSPKAFAEVVEKMLALKVRRLFVVDGEGALIGVISAIDVLGKLRSYGLHDG